MNSNATDRTARLVAIGSLFISLVVGGVTVVNFFETRKNTAELQERQVADRLVEAYDKLGGQERAVLAIRYSAATSQIEKARVIEAGRIIESVLRSAPKNQRALELHGIYYGRLGDGDRAVRELRDLVKTYPRYASGWNALGDALLASGQLDDAIAAFRESIALDATDPKPHNGLGVALAHKSLLELAINEYERSLVLDSRVPAVHCNLGIALFKQQRFGDALDEVQKAIALDPSDPLCYNTYGTILRSRHRDADADKAFDTGKRLEAHTESAR